MALLTQEYERNIRKEQIKRFLLAFIILLILVNATGAVFMLPSYFFAAFSKDEILRRLKFAEEVLVRRNSKAVEEEISKINGTIAMFEKNELRRRELAPLLIKIANATPQSITLKLLKLEITNDGSSSLTINGSAQRREDFLSYFEKLKKFDEAEAVISPVANLLRETDVFFVLEFKIKKENYSYAP